MLWCTVWIAGCAPTKATVKTIRDTDKGYTIQQLQGNLLGGSRSYQTGRLYFNLERIERQDGQITYALLIEYEGENWLFIERGESLVLRINGQEQKLKGEGSWRSRDVSEAGYAIERARYPLTLLDLLRLASAQRVEVEVIGSQRRVQGWFTEENFRYLRRFIADYVQASEFASP
ncbi:MAG: hypothetical protein D6736_20885 [Nitrospinota bacterium]|nr:MAG: hypothetical protein D6736_20885 [Nitrospinota bacterium]